ncbi:MarR family transcriptional regulator [Inquilinus limosus]|uniref:MarR family winged helix-turn-helix transcriptional regulator n=1 Tax=Inquilinus limosus TaxID=171674 RepID=UPI003F183D3B
MHSDDRTNNLLGALVVALGDAMRASVEKASGHGLTASAALATAFFYPGKSVDVLRRILGLSGAGATRLIDGLQANGLVERRASLDDRRSRAVLLTEAGSKCADEVLKARRAVYSRALAALSTDERNQLARMLDSMLTALTPDRATCDRTCRLCDIAACPQDICPVELAALRVEGAE